MGNELSIYITAGTQKKDSLNLTNTSGKSYLVRLAKKNQAELQKTFSFKNNNVAYVKPDGTKVYKGIAKQGEKNPLDTPYGRKILGNIFDRAKELEKQGKTADKAVAEATKAAIDEAKAQREKEINRIMKRNKCSRHDAEVKYLQNNGISKEEAEEAVNKRERKENSKEKANNPNYDPKTSLGFGYRQILRYLQAAASCGYVLVKLDSETQALANKYHLEVVDGYVKIPKAELEKAAKEVEDKENLDRKEFYKNAACDRCGHNHHGAIKNDKETK